MITCMYTPARCECGSWLEGCIFLQVMCDASRIVDGWNAALVDRHFIPLVCYIPDGARFSHEQLACSPGDHHKYHISECSCTGSPWTLYFHFELQEHPTRHQTSMVNKNMQSFLGHLIRPSPPQNTSLPTKNATNSSGMGGGRRWLLHCSHPDQHVPKAWKTELYWLKQGILLCLLVTFTY